nr:gustatory receptor [Semanotus bifasciatus]
MYLYYIKYIKRNCILILECSNPVSTIPWNIELLLLLSTIYTYIYRSYIS